MARLEDLQVWQKSVALATEVYVRTRDFPPEERYGLTSQIHRASVSVASNIAEGYGRFQENDFIRFLRIACGSVHELRTQLLIAKNTGMLNASDFTTLLAPTHEIERMIGALITALQNKPERTAPRTV